MTLAEYILLVSRGDGPSPRVFPPTPREPLPSFPGLTDAQPGAPQASCWAQTPFLSTLPGVWGTTPNVRIHRGNFFGHRVAGLTEGGESDDPTLTCTWDWVRYSPTGLALSVDSYWSAGYTHPVLSRPQTLNMGLGLADLQRAARSTKRAGMFNVVVAISDGAPFSDAVEWLDALHAEGLVDEVCVCWQADRYYSPMELVKAAMDAAAWAHPKGILVSIHWMNAEACAWWDPEDCGYHPNTCDTYGICDRWSYQQVMSAFVDVHHGQANTEAPCDALQAWIHKVVISLRPNQAFCAAELDAQAQQDDPFRRLELYGDQKGLLCCCVESPTVTPVTFLNGGRLPNGGAIVTPGAAIASAAHHEAAVASMLRSASSAPLPPLPVGIAPTFRQIAPNRHASHPLGVGTIEDWEG